MDEDKRRSGRRGFNTGELPALAKYFSNSLPLMGERRPINYVAVQNEPLYETGAIQTMF